MDRLREPLLAALDTVLVPRRVILRNDSAARALEGLPQETAVARGEGGPIAVREGGCAFFADPAGGQKRSEEHTSELQSLMRISYAVFCLKKKTRQNHHTTATTDPNEQPTS